LILAVIEAVSMNEATCTFCRKFYDMRERRWYDKEVYRDRNFALIPGVGPFGEGYFILLTLHHYRSFATIPDAMWTELLSFKRTARTMVESVFGSAMFFEHGPGPKTRGGSCIDHAHWHVMPLVRDLVATLRSEYLFKPIELLGLRQLTENSYLFIEDENSHGFAAIADSVPGQYIRRVIAHLEGRDDEWDYAAYPRYEIIQSTLQRLSDRRYVE